jgi:hypothetical protein
MGTFAKHKNPKLHMQSIMTMIKKLEIPTTRKPTTKVTRSQKHK